MSTKCQYSPVTSICTAPPPENHRMPREIGHHADQADADDQVDGVQARHEEVKDEEHLHLSADRAAPARPATGRAPGTWKFQPGDQVLVVVLGLFDGLDPEESRAQHHRQHQPDEQRPMRRNWAARTASAMVRLLPRRTTVLTQPSKTFKCRLASATSRGAVSPVDGEGRQAGRRRTSPRSPGTSTSRASTPRSAAPRRRTDATGSARLRPGCRRLSV